MVPLRHVPLTLPSPPPFQNLPVDLDESDVSSLLAACPNITEVRMGRDRSTGRNKGFAFVDFATGTFVWWWIPGLVW